MKSIVLYDAPLSRIAGAKILVLWVTFALLPFHLSAQVDAVALVAVHVRRSTFCTRSRIQPMTGTAIELPSALYLGPSGQLSAVLLRHGICE